MELLEGVLRYNLEKINFLLTNLRDSLFHQFLNSKNKITIHVPSCEHKKTCLVPPSS